MRLTQRTADLLGLRILSFLVKKRFFRANALRGFSWESFHALRKRAKKSFLIPESSITPLMSRTLYGISALSGAQRVVCVGSYLGNALLWLAGPGIMQSRPGAQYYGIDTSADAIRAAQANFRRLGASYPVSLICADGHAIQTIIHEPIDLLLIDVEDESGKKIYSSILDLAYPRVRTGGLVLAHDIVVPKFKKDVVRYRQHVKDRKRFLRSTTLAIDYCGLEVSKKV